MKQEERKKIYNDALSRYGIRNQRIMVFEECGELINVIAKSNRLRATIPEIITELADVHIMVEQMALYYGWEEFLAERDRKLQRLQERLLEKGGAR